MQGPRKSWSARGEGQACPRQPQVSMNKHGGAPPTHPLICPFPGRGHPSPPYLLINPSFFSLQHPSSPRLYLPTFPSVSSTSLPSLPLSSPCYALTALHRRAEKPELAISSTTLPGRALLVSPSLPPQPQPSPYDRWNSPQVDESVSHNSFNS